MTYITNTAKDHINCPTCGAAEMDVTGTKLQIRGHKVHRDGNWHSQCLVCSGAFNFNHEPAKGWFVSNQTGA